ncbi:MAG: CBS domain-containing protein [Candidatus Eisenbacteria bacterium]|uniref:CBS domain-containing protein n=1 Tax=Eiseniibacteriota bacterium TaxID=2212470 RepID=A0A7Y2EAT9_UNCEI|nr:CBS domain-containing protein [Candidatus Eisenbacteria bacterium]
MDPASLGWILLTLFGVWLTATAAGVHRELMLLETPEGEGSDYDFLSQLRRLRDDPVSLGLRLRFSRRLAVGSLPLSLLLVLGSAQIKSALLALLLGWLLYVLADFCSGFPWARRALRWPVVGIGSWLRITSPVSELQRVVRLRTAETSSEPESGFVGAESQAVINVPGATLRPSGRLLFRRLIAAQSTSAESIMTSWSGVSSVDLKATSSEVANTILVSGRSRLPVTDPKDPMKVVGLVTTKDVLNREGNGEGTDHLIRPPYFVRASANIDELLDEFRSAHVHLGVVLDSLGRTVGIVTMEDILEEIVGELHDEREAPEEQA